jgi:hypothetical protein
METRSSRPIGPGAILGIIGGAALVIGSFLTWVTVSLDIAKFAQILGVSPAALQGATSSTTFSAAGTHGDGKITLVVGIIAVVGAILVLTTAARKAGYAVVAVAGVIGAGICVFEIASKSSQINDALSNAGPALAAAGISADTLKSVFNVSWGIGLWICLAGGVVALIGGIIGLMSKGAPAMQSAPMAGATAMDSPVNSGFDAPAPPVAPSPPTVPPVAPPTTDVTPPTITTPPPTEPPPTEPPPTEPPPTEPTPPPTQGGGTGMDQPPG